MVASTSTEPDVVDTRDMVVVHTALLREFRLMPALIRGVTDGDTRQAGLVGASLHFLADLLHHHHAGEDELLWPKLLERIPNQLLPLLAVMESQHHHIDHALKQVQTALQAWMVQANTASRDHLATQVERLHAHLIEHLDAEERSILPLAAVNLSHAEWCQIGERGMAAIPKRKLPLVFGMFMYEGDPQVLKDMLGTAPALPRLLLPRIAPVAYARYARAVHGTRTP